MIVRRVRAEEHREAGRVTAAAYEEFLPGEDSPNADYRARVADVGARARHALVLVAVEDGTILGSVTLELDRRIPGGHRRPPLMPDEAHVRMLGVDPTAQRRGIGRALMDASATEARRAGKQRITLQTTEAMVAAQQLYRSMGFRRIGETVFDDGFRLEDYELPLD
jgi:ribosomal protein S18 acetylase RimI-like enzyme